MASEKKPSPAPAPQAPMTAFASAAMLMADVLTERHARSRWGTPARKLKIEEPSGPSTGGGRRARQNLTLVPVDGGTSIAAGWLDVSSKEALLRSYESLERKYAGRLGGKLDLSEKDYDRFISDVSEDLGKANFRLYIVMPEEESAASQASAPRAAGMGLGLVIPFVLAAFGLGIALGFLLAR